MGILAGKISIVTGAAQGIGKAIAKRFVAEGAEVVMLDADAATLYKAADEISANVLPLETDIGEETSVKKVVNHAISQLGEIDILVNNAAARSHRAKITELALETWELAIRVNLTGAFLMCRAVLPSMQRAGGGIIINVASQLGSVAVPGSAAYCTTKGGMLQLTRALALDHAADGIRVNSLSPGAVMTSRILDLYGSEEDTEAALSAKHPIGRIGRPEEIAGAALFLASPDTTFMTGADLVVDGGYLAQ